MFDRAPELPVQADTLPMARSLFANGDRRRLLVASNRLPVVMEFDGTAWTPKPGSGGLVTALAPIMRANGGVWVGWPGDGSDRLSSQRLDDVLSGFEYQLRPVLLSDEQVERYYRGFSNESVWPLFHDLLGYCRFDTVNWRYYREVNLRFAEAIRRNVQADSLIWVHDYQLMMVAHFMRRLDVQLPLHFFLHIPFPSRDLFRRLPWRQHLIEGLLAFDHLGFQTSRDSKNFIQCVRSFVPEAKVSSTRGTFQVKFENRVVRVGHYPISIDFAGFDRGARSQEVMAAATELREAMRTPTLMLGVDRLDYTKGVLERILAFERMLETHPDALEQITLLQVVIPSRTRVPDYVGLKNQIDTAAGRINARFSSHTWVPIKYYFRSLDFVQLLGHYRACQIALITPLRDGMNLVAKEYCAASVDNDGCLILSEFAGAAEQLYRGAILVNPYDIDATAEAIYFAYRMPRKDRILRMRMLRAEIRRWNVRRWVRSFLQEAARAG